MTDSARSRWTLTWGLLALILSRVESVPWIAGLWTLVSVGCLIATAILNRRARRSREGVAPRR